MDHNIALKLDNITKLYPGVVALDDVSISFREGEVHAIVGENGAGKSTLIKTITGAIQPEKGTITISHDGTSDSYNHIQPAVARKHGIECIYQEYNLIDSLSAAENICYGTRFGMLVDYKQMNRIAQEVFDRFSIDIPPSALVRDLTSAQCQIVEISKAITKDVKVLILDEPTAPLTVAETDVLMNIISQLKAEGTTILYISHRLDEIFRISDRVSVFRDGRFITTLVTVETNRAELIKYMVGRDLSETYPVRVGERGNVAIELKSLTGNGVKNISFQAHRGEILGIAGLVGAGRSEIMKVVFGAERKQWGEVLVDGKPAKISTPRHAMAYGVGLIPEDRKREGCFLLESVSWNIVYNMVRKISKFTVINRKKEREIADSYSKRLRIKTPSLEQKVLNLSGGNQQKVVIAKALAADTDIIIFDEPTRGIDVGAKHEIYELMNELCAEGKCIIMVTSDMEELLGMSDRIVVFAEHVLAGELSKDQFSQEAVLELASGSLDQKVGA